MALSPQPPRRALTQALGSLSLATDLAAGIANEGALRTSLAAALIAQLAGERDGRVAECGCVALLRYMGCSGYAHEEAHVGAGDDMAMLGALEVVDPVRPGTLLSAVFSRLARDAGFVDRTRAIARLLSDPKGYARLARAHCAQAVELASTLTLQPSVVAAMGHLYERWDGRGEPTGRRGDALAFAARVTHLATVVEVHLRAGGPAAAVAEVRARSGGQLDPGLADVFLAHAPEVLGALTAPTVWDAWLAAVPEVPWAPGADPLQAMAVAFARYADLKCPTRLGHSEGVAGLCARVAVRARLDEGAARELRLAALLHDVGVTSVPNGVLDKAGPLLPGEWARARDHAAHTERILQRVDAFAPIAAAAGAHHERVDGSGYPRGASGDAVSLSARVLAVCDAFHAQVEPRAWRAAKTDADALRSLADDARESRLDREVLGWLSEVLGHEAPRLKGAGPDGLSDREVEVLDHLARGLSNKEIGARMFISARTVQEHVRHIYEKTGVSSRASAALYATQRGLVGRFAEYERALRPPRSG